MAGLIQHFIQSLNEFREAGARNDDRVTTAVRLFRKAEKSTAIVLAELDDDVFTLHLELLAGEGLVHFRSPPGWERKRAAPYAIGRRTRKGIC